VSTEYNSFMLSVRGFKVATERQAKQLQAKVTLQLLRGVILGNPVDTGRMRGGWVVGVGDAPDYEPPEKVTDKGRALSARHMTEAASTGQRLSELPLGTPTYVVNNVSYSAHVNRLHKNKARFVEAAIENVKSQFTKGAP